MTEPAWSLESMGSWEGRRVLVTGVTSGIGLHTAEGLARAGAEVVLAARNPAKLARTQAEMRTRLPDAALVPLVLDLADLGSVRRAADEASALGPLDVLINNAGVMATPHTRTVDGFEMQMGTNHFGHFALTGLLLDSLVRSGAGRVVTVSSLMARAVRHVSVEDPRLPPRKYRPWSAYQQSKLANLLFTSELDRRLRARDLRVVAVAAHPGYAHTNLVASSANQGWSRAEAAIGLGVTALVGQTPELGATPILRAATEPDLPGGSYIGPSGPLQLRGLPTRVRMPRQAQDLALAASLWRVSEAATGVVFP